MDYGKLPPRLLKLIKDLSKVENVKPVEGMNIVEGLDRFDWFVDLGDGYPTRLCLIYNQGIKEQEEKRKKKEYKQTSFDFKKQRKITRRNKSTLSKALDTIESIGKRKITRRNK